MTIKPHVCTLEQSKKLTEFGIIQNSLFEWWEYLDEGVNEWQSDVLFKDAEMDDNIKYALANAKYSAYTATELGTMLGIENLPYFSVEYDMWMLPKESKLKGAGLGSINEAVIRAELLIYALNKHFLSVSVCNNRVTE